MSLMKKRDVFYKSPIIPALSGIIILCLISMAVIKIQSDRKTKMQVSYTQLISSVPYEVNDAYIVFGVSKSWFELNGDIGAQYDGVFTNTTNHNFVDWKVEITVPERYYVKSQDHWNGDYTFSENRIVVTAPTETHSENTDKYFKAIPKKGNIGFGFVMYTKSLFEIKNITITGRFVYRACENIIFKISYYIAIIVGVIFLFLIIFAITVQKRVKATKQIYETIRVHDLQTISQAFSTFANIVDAVDSYTTGHSVRVGKYAKELTRRLGKSKQEQLEVYWIGLVHDIGKIAVPQEILKKPGRLTDDEYSEMKEHPTIGFNILKDFSAIPHLQEVVLHHHERYDGNGYPSHMKGEEIPFFARLLCVADSFDAMRYDRCYRKKLSNDVIIAELTNNQGKQFDPDIAKVMIDMIKDNFPETIDDSKNVEIEV